MGRMEKGATRSGAPLAELIVSIGVFAFAGALTLQLFLGARFAAAKARDLNWAVMTAQTLAEEFKAFGGEDGVFYYDEDWKPSEQPALFTVEVSVSEGAAGMRYAGITVRRERPYPFLKEEEDSTLLYGLSAARYEGGKGGER